MSEYEKMRKDGYEQSSRDKDTYSQRGKQDLYTHPDDPNFVKRGGSNDGWERYDADKHNKDK